MLNVLTPNTDVHNVTQLIKFKAEVDKFTFIVENFHQHFYQQWIEQLGKILAKIQKHSTIVPTNRT